jgi:hypothetical protein
MAESAFLGAGPYLKDMISLKKDEIKDAYRTGTRRITDLARSMLSTATSPSRFVWPYSWRGFVWEDGVYGGDVPSNT